MDIVFFVIFCFLSGVVFSFLSRNHGKMFSRMAKVFFVLGWIFVGLHVVCYAAPIDFLENLPGVTVEDSEYVDVPQGGVVLLRTGQGTVFNDFYFGPTVALSDLQSYLKASVKTVYFYVKSGTDILYVKDMGRLSELDADMLLSMYEIYVSDGSLPRGKVVCNLLGLVRISR